MLDRESILRRGGELELECPDLGSDLMGNNGESKLSYYKHLAHSDFGFNETNTKEEGHFDCNTGTLWV